MVKASVIQTTGTLDKAKNIEKTAYFIRAAAKDGARIIGLQEFFNTIYFCIREDQRYFDLAETIPGPTTDAIAKVAKEEGIVVVTPIYERDPTVVGVRYNSAAVIGADGSILGVYRKHSIPNVRTATTSGNEKFYFNPGNNGFPVFETPFGVRVGVIICYDRHFPEHSRCLALNGADLMLVPTATWGISQPVWEIELKGHAVFNLFYVGGANRVGPDEGEQARFFGSSMLVSPAGEVLSRASDKEEGFVSAEIDLDLIARLRNDWGLYRDRRPDAYGALVR